MSRVRSKLLHALMLAVLPVVAACSTGSETEHPEMSFKWLNKLTVESDEGFIFGPFRAQWQTYREGDRILRLSGEPLYSDNEGARWGYVIYTDLKTARWDPPYENEVISAEHAERIRANILAAAEFMDGNLVFHH